VGGLGGSLNPLPLPPGESYRRHRLSPPPLQPYTLIVRGATMASLLAEPGSRARFGALCLSADSVICCRVTPRQKGLLVRLVKDAGHLTLAVGDGGNDVAMIQEAAVGVGIRGKEGLQAARAADFAVPHFRSLQRLLLVHGRYAYVRTCLIAQYSFYKSFFFCCCQILFGFASGFAGVSAFNSLCVAAYNVVVFVPIVFFITDRDIAQATALALPEAYTPGSARALMTPATVAAWMARGLWQAVVTVAIAAYGAAATRAADFQAWGLLLYFGYSWVQDLTMLFAMRRVTVINVAAIFGMHGLAFGAMLAANAIGGPLQSLIDAGSLTAAAADPAFWLVHLLTAAACVLPVEAARAYVGAYAPSFDADLLAADAEVERMLGAAAAAAAGGAGAAWRGDVLAAGGPGGLARRVRAAAAAAARRAGSSRNAAAAALDDAERPTRPLLLSTVDRRKRISIASQDLAAAAAAAAASHEPHAPDAYDAAAHRRGSITSGLSRPSYNSRHASVELLPVRSLDG